MRIVYYNYLNTILRLAYLNVSRSKKNTFVYVCLKRKFLTMLGKPNDR